MICEQCIETFDTKMSHDDTAKSGHFSVTCCILAVWIRALDRCREVRWFITVV